MISMGKIAEELNRDWPTVYSDIIGGKSRLINAMRILAYLQTTQNNSAVYSEIQKGTTMPKSSLKDSLRDMVRLNWLEKKGKYYLIHKNNVKDDYGWFQNPMYCQYSRNLLLHEVYDNPQFSPEQKAEIAFRYIYDHLLDKYSKIYLKRFIAENLSGREKVTDLEFQDYQEPIIFNFNLAKQEGFADELYRLLMKKFDSIYDLKWNKEIDRYTEKKFKEFSSSSRTKTSIHKSQS